MARRRFGVDLTSLVWTTTDIEDNLDVVQLVRHADNITVWNAREGGEQITDLTSLNGTPLTDGVVQSDEHGMFAFYGPDTDPPTVEVWIDAGLGARQLAVATDLGPEYVSFSSRIDEVEAAIGDLDLEAVDGLVEDVADLQGDVGDLEGSLSSLSGTVSGLSGTVSSLSGTVSGLSSTVSGLSSTVSGHTSSINDLTAAVAFLAPVFVVKSANESVSSSTTLQNDDELLVSLTANRTYEISGVLRVSGSTSGDITIAWTGPAGSTMHTVVHGLGASGSAGSDDIIFLYEGPGTASPGTFGTTATIRAIHYHGFIRVGGDSGNLRLVWAQGSSNATATVVHSGSFMCVRRVV